MAFRSLTRECPGGTISDFIRSILHAIVYKAVSRIEMGGGNTARAPEVAVLGCDLLWDNGDFIVWDNDDNIGWEA